MKIRIILLIICILTVSLYSACGAKPSGEIMTMKFNDDFQYAKYGGRQVTIRGYMSTLSPMDGKFIYLMNMPYQSCPFCLPNNTTIVNTIAVYAPESKRFDFYDGPIEITGTIEVGDVKDDFGYEYPFKIVDAKYTKIDTAQLSENLKIYGALTQDGIINDIMRVTGQVDFNAFFEVYNMTIDDVKLINGDEFNKIIQRIRAISDTDYADIIEILENFKTYNEEVNRNIDSGEYSQNTTPEMEEKIIILFNSLFEWLNRFEI